MQNQSLKQVYLCANQLHVSAIYIATSIYMYNQVKFSCMVLAVSRRRVIFGPRTSS